MRVKIFDLSWNVDLNRLENEINVFLAMLGDAPDFVEVGEAGIAVGDAMRRERRVQLVG
jgi:hypothetical protein